jgi:hypothetical protein
MFIWPALDFYGFILPLLMLLFFSGTEESNASDLPLFSSSIDICVYVIFATPFSSLAMAMLQFKSIVLLLVSENNIFDYFLLFFVS